MKKKVIYGCRASGTQYSPLMTRISLLETKWGELCLHIFHRSDGHELHDHPWSFVSLILWGGYIEEAQVFKPRFLGEPLGTSGLWITTRKRKWPGMLLFRRAEWRHRVELVKERPSVTLVWKTMRFREWGFFTAKGWQKWTEFFQERGC